MEAPGAVARWLRRLDEVIGALTHADTSVDVLAVAARHARSLCAATGAVVAPLGPADGVVDIVRAVGEPADFVARVTRGELSGPELISGLRGGQPWVELPGISRYPWLIAVPLPYRGTAIGVLILAYDDRPPPGGELADLVRTYAGQCALALERTRLFEAQQLAGQRLSYLAEASEILAGSLDIEETLHRLAGLIVPRLADWCVIHLLDGGEAVPVVIRHHDVEAERSVVELLDGLVARPSEAGVGAVLRTGRTLLLPVVTASLLAVEADGVGPASGELRGLPLGVGVVVPLATPHGTLGAMTLVRERGPAYAGADVELAEEIGKRAGFAVDTARAHLSAERERERLTTVLDQLPVGVVLAEAPSGRVVLHNRASEEIWRQPVEAFDRVADYGRLRAFRVGGTPLRADDWPLSRAVRTGEEVRGERVEIRWDDATTTTIEINAGPVRDRQGRVIAGVAAFTEVSARVAAERALTDSRRRAVALAHTLQASLLPPRLPEVPGIELAAEYLPVGEGLEVGGDFYDVIETSREDEWALVIGDVCGKGAEAAAVTALARYTVRAAALRARRPAVILSQLNEAMLHHDSERPFLTAVYVALRQVGDEVAPFRATMSVGGHPPPYVVRADGTVTSVEAEGSLVGVFEEAEFTDVTIPLAPGDLLVCYTDGLTEARAGGEQFGEDRLRDLLAGCRGLTAARTVAAIRSAVQEFSDGPPRDDLALLVARVR